MGVDRKTAARAFHDLQAKGFIVMTEVARLGIAGAACSPAWEITEVKMPASDQQDGRKLYGDGRAGRDFLVHVTTANNPRGANGMKPPGTAGGAQGDEQILVPKVGTAMSPKTGTECAHPSSKPGHPYSTTP